MDEDDLFDKRDLRRKKEKKRQHKVIKEREDCTRESFKKMKEEIDDLRKKEIERAKELEELKKMIEQKERDTDESPKKQTEEVEYALEFDKNTYLSKGFIESAIWIKNVLAKNLMKKIENEKECQRFATIMMSKKASAYLGYRACARFNRGEECNLGKWHLTHKPDGLWTKQHQREHSLPRTDYNDNEGGRRHRPADCVSKKNELRLHICTLCLEAFGSALGHNVLNCPWILKKNWTE